MTSRSVYDQVLYLAVLAELQLEHLLRHVRGHPVHPDTLGGHAHPEPESDLLATDQLSVRCSDSFDDRADVNKLDKSIVRFLDVDFENFSKLFKPLMYFRWLNLNVSH